MTLDRTALSYLRRLISVPKRGRFIKILLFECERENKLIPLLFNLNFWGIFWEQLKANMKKNFLKNAQQGQNNIKHIFLLPSPFPIPIPLPFPLPSSFLPDAIDNFEFIWQFPKMKGKPKGTNFCSFSKA